MQVMGKPDMLDMFGTPNWVPRPWGGKGRRGRRRACASPPSTPSNAAAPRARRAMICSACCSPRAIPETGRGLSDVELRDNVVTFIGAGHETTALTLDLHALPHRQHARRAGAPAARSARCLRRQADRRRDGRGSRLPRAGHQGVDAALSARRHHRPRRDAGHRSRRRAGEEGRFRLQPHLHHAPPQDAVGEPRALRSRTLLARERQGASIASSTCPSARVLASASA